MSVIMCLTGTHAAAAPLMAPVGSAMTQSTSGADSPQAQVDAQQPLTASVGADQSGQQQSQAQQHDSASTSRDASWAPSA